MRPFISCLFCVAAGLLLSGNPILATPTKADPTDVASTRPDIDEEPDGLTNQEEAEAGAFPYNAYSDADSVMDGVDGWALNPELHPPRFSQSGYALIRLTAGSIAPNAICINNKSHVLFHSIVNFDSQSVTTPASIWNGTSIIVLPDDLAEVSQLNENDEVVGVIYHRSGEELEISQDDLVKWNASTGLQTMTPVHTNTFDKGYESFAIGSGTIFSRYIASNSENTSAWIGFAKWTTGSPQIQDDEYTCLPSGDMSPTVGKSFYPLTANNNNLLLGQMINFRRIPVEGPPGRYSAEYTDWKYAMRIADTEIALQDFVQGTPVYASDLSNSNPEAFVVAQLGSFEDLAVFAGEGAAWRLAYRSSTFNDKVFGPASRINSNAQMIGSFTSTYGTDHAGQLINNAVAVDLQKYLPLGTTLTKAIDINDSGIILAKVTANNASDAALLVPFEVISDLNNNGRIDGGDRTLKTAGAKATATDEQKEKATEYLFANDNLSNGAWDKEDTDSSKPASATDDDDAEEISVTCAATWGAVWFEHPAIDKLSFYKTKECLPADKMTFPFALSTEETGKLPEKLYVRLDGADFTAQAEGDLVMKFGKADQSETWAEDKLKFTIVSQIGDAKYFNAARDYMTEKNSRVHVRIFKSGSQQIRITAMRHEATDMKVIETYHRTPKIYGLPGVTSASGDSYDLILNGNFCYFEGGHAGRIWGMANHQMTSRCHGGCVVSGVQNPATSVGGTHGLEQPSAEYLSASGKGTFGITTGVVPLPPTHQNALGGFASNLVGGLYAMHPWFGVAETGPTGDRKKYIFTVTQTVASTSYPLANLVQRLTDSGQLICVAGDGGSSTAIAYRTEGASTRVLYAGDKHYPGHYWINTYITFKSDKPRL